MFYVVFILFAMGMGVTASSAEVKNTWSYTSTPPLRLHGVMPIYVRVTSS